jgi:heparan-alpha-glucosaminide N-acetyltransferase
VSTVAPSPPQRLAAIDAYRGFVMLLMMGEVLEFGRMAAKFPDNSVWRFLALHQSHVEWAGCNLHDLIQPSFSFLVGAALPFSLANRAERGQSLVRVTAHAFWRSLLLIALGIFLRSMGSRNLTNYTFEDTLTQIGLGYFFLYLLGLAGPRFWWGGFLVVLIGYFIAFACYPLPDESFSYAAVGVKPDWPPLYSGFAAHWNKNSNVAWAFDCWFLNLFPRKQPFTYNGGGYATLSFIPTLATMILGMIAGGWLRQDDGPGKKLARLAVCGLLFLGLGFGADYFGICPNVKRIWTSSWVLFSGGWCFLILAGFYALLDAIGWKAWAFPLRVIGMNSIAAYCMAHLWHGFMATAFRTHWHGVVEPLFKYCPYQDVIKDWCEAHDAFVMGVFVLLAYWLILFWMYRRRIFLRI